MELINKLNTKIDHLQELYDDDNYEELDLEAEKISELFDQNEGLYDGNTKLKIAFNQALTRFNKLAKEAEIYMDTDDMLAMMFPNGGDDDFDDESM